MAKQLTAPGCVYTIVARVDTTIYSPDQTWILDVPAGQADFIAETNEIIIPADAMMRRKTRQHAKDRDRINLLGVGSGSLEGFITRAIEQIVGKGNVEVTYGDGKLTVVLAESATTAQIAIVENLLERMLPKDVTEEISDAPIGYTRLYFLESSGGQYIDTGIQVSENLQTNCEFLVPYFAGQNMWFYGAGFKVFAVLAYFFRDESAYAYYSQDALRLEPLNENEKYLIEQTKEYTKLNDKKYLFSTEGAIRGEMRLFGIKNPAANEVNFSGRVFSFSISRNSRLQCNYIPTLDPAGKPCMFDAVTRKPFYNTATTGSDFIAGMTWEQAQGLHLPTTGGKLTLSLPYEASIDNLTQAALEQARANGWELTLQYDEVEIPAGYSKLDFLASTGTQWMVIPFENNGAVTTTVEMQWTDIAGRQLLGYNPNSLYFGVNDQNVNGWDFYYSAAWKNYSPLDKHQFAFFVNADGKDGYAYLDGENALRRPNESALPERFYLWCLGNGNFKCIARVFVFHIVTEAGLVRNLVPCLDPDGTPCMYDTVTQQPFRNNGTGQFVAGMTWEQVRKLQLPTTGGQLTLSLPYEASIDGIAQTALDRARANGWELTLQYDEAEVPAGYSKLDFLESTGTQYIDTGLKLSNESEVKCGVEFLDLDTTAYFYGSKTTWLTDDYSACFQNSNNQRFITLVFGKKYVNFHEINLTERITISVSSKGFVANGMLKTVDNVEAFETPSSCLLYSLHSVDHVGHKIKARIYTFSISRSNSLQLAYIPCLDPEGVPCMFDLVSRQPFRNKGTGQFIAGMTLEQVRNLSLPAGGGELTLALPHEASIDRLAQAALERARENGWQLTLQYAESDVPAGYRKLDFLESTGTQKLNITTTSSYIEAIVDIQYTQTELDQYQGFITASSFFGTNANGQWLTTGQPAVKATTDRIIITSTFDHAAVDIDYGGLATKIVTTTQDTCPQFCLFGRSTNYSYCRIYSAKISKSTELVCDYVPCIAPDGTLGMYNKVDGTVRENAGEGSFIAGLATVDDVLNLWLPETGRPLTISVPADTPDDAVEQLRTNNPTWQIAIQYRTDNEN